MIGAATPVQGQGEPKLVPAVSREAIEIQYSFAGEDLLLFGAILYPNQRQPDAKADIVVVLKGPVRPITVREKKRIAGMWVNADSQRFRSAPGYYALASSRPVSEIVDERTASIYELGLSNLQLSPTGNTDPQRLTKFERGLIGLYGRTQLYHEDPAGVLITDGVLYRARIPVSARVPVGRYVAETYLISRGRVLAVASRDVVVRKTGFERFVARAAQRHGLLYGLVAIGLSVALGWVAGMAFNRR